MKIFKAVIFIVFSLVAIVIGTVGIAILIGTIQEKLFVPQEYLMWIFKSPASMLVLIWKA